MNTKKTEADFPLNKECVENDVKLTITMRFTDDGCENGQMHMWDLVLSDGWRAVGFCEMPTVEEILKAFGYLY